MRTAQSDPSLESRCDRVPGVEELRCSARRDVAPHENDMVYLSPVSQGDRDDKTGPPIPGVRLQMDEGSVRQRARRTTPDLCGHEIESTDKREDDRRDCVA